MMEPCDSILAAIWAQLLPYLFRSHMPMPGRDITVELIFVRKHYFPARPASPFTIVQIDFPRPTLAPQRLLRLSHCGTR